MAVTLREQGYRFLVDPALTPLPFKWVHPAEVAQMIAAGWVDTTDMDDDEYDAFIDSTEK